MADHYRSHYLAQSYLKGFAYRGRRDAIWQYRKSTNEIRLKGIRNVAYRPYYYSEDSCGTLDHTLEEWFAGVESSWPSLRSAVESNLQAVNLKETPRRINSELRHRILQYVLIQYLRVPAQMEWMKAYVGDNHPRSGELTDSEKQRLRVKGLGHTHDYMLDRWVLLLASRDLSIEAAPAGSGVTVFTCDNPVIRRNRQGPDGIIYDTTHVLFPVSRRSLICFGGDHVGTMHDGVMIKVHHDPEVITCFNHLVVEKATEEVYASNPHQLRDQLREMGCNVRLRCPSGRPDHT